MQKTRIKLLLPIDGLLGKGCPMKTQVISCALFGLASLVCQVAAQPPPTLLPPLQTKDAAKEQPKDPGKHKEQKLQDKKLTEPPKDDIFAQAPAQRFRLPTLYNPHI